MTPKEGRGNMTPRREEDSVIFCFASFVKALSRTILPSFLKTFTFFNWFVLPSLQISALLKRTSSILRGIRKKEKIQRLFFDGASSFTRGTNGVNGAFLRFRPIDLLWNDKLGISNLQKVCILLYFSLSDPKLHPLIVLKEVKS